ncbi:MAG: hypothetical protein RL020_2212 [Pseudomonadota bacterium]|jgi:hypothetical protein
MKLYASLLLFILAVASQPATARPFPEEAQAGTLQAADFPFVKIGSSVIRFAPGARIFNETNMAIMPTALPEAAKVLYQLDIMGLVLNLWLLNDDEAADLKKAGKKF